MCSINDLAHLFESAKGNTDMFTQRTACNNLDCTSCNEAALEAAHDKGSCKPESCKFTHFLPEREPVAPSPWVNRNLDGAQLTRARGSMYEG